MTIDELRATEVVLKALQARGRVSDYGMTSWTTPLGIDYAWRVSTPTLSEALILNRPFDSNGFTKMEAFAMARYRHSATMQSVWMQAADRMLRELADIYVENLNGGSLTVPVEKQLTVSIPLHFPEPPPL